ncbi:MAG: hypothetical protein WCL24_04785 [Verrucomicrobiota bacterium]
MRKTHLWLVAVVGLGVLLGFWWHRRSARVPPPAAPAAARPAPPPEVPIQDRQAIDFSSGRPVVNASAAEQARLAAAEQEMADAARHIRFDPTPPPPAEPAPARPKP